MRWSMREGPWGSHHDEARALKWEISEGSMEEDVECQRRAWTRDGRPRERRSMWGRESMMEGI